MISIGKRLPACLGACALLLWVAPAAAQMRITEFMYSGTNGEIIEFTNVGAAPVDMTGWSFDDNSQTPGSTPLSAYGVVAPGESVLLTEIDGEIFRSAWGLCSAVKIIGSNANNLGRNDELNLYDAGGTLVDRLGYGDETFPGTIRTQNISGRVDAVGLGANQIGAWSLSAAGDAEGSRVSVGGDVGSPGHSAHATVAFDPCPMAGGRMRISEYLYSGGSGEYIEFTNVGDAPVDLAGWSFSDNARNPGDTPLAALGSVAPGESVVLTDVSAEAFRASWNLCPAAKVLGGNTHNLSRADEINLYDAGGAQVDRLTYGDETFPGTIRTQNVSGWADAIALGENTIAAWVLSAAGDAQHSTASQQGDIGSPARNAQSSAPFDPCPPEPAPMRITEYMYSGADGEFIEFTNVGTEPIDMGGWSFDDNSRTPGTEDLSEFGAVQPGESVILTESDASAFRSAWGLCEGYKVIGGLASANLGNGDEINLYDATDALVDRLTYPNGGPPLANGFSAWVPASALGANDASQWVLSASADAEGSIASSGGAVGRPGHSARAPIAYDPCSGAPQLPTITLDAAATSPFLDLGVSVRGAVSGVIGDPTDPAATTGIGFVFAPADGGDPSTLTIAATSSNTAVVDAAGLALAGSGATRQLTITPRDVGYATIIVSATDASNHAGTYTIRYAASAAASQPQATRFLTGASDASATVALDAGTMLVADDETNVLRVYDRRHSGLPFAGFDFSGELNLTDPENPELDIEGSARVDDRVFWTTSFSNSKNFHVRPNRHRVFATDLSGSAAGATLAYAGRYDWLLEDLVAWDQANGHGLGTNTLGFAASSAEGVDSKTPEGFNIEGLAIAPDGLTAYFAFRAPLLPTTDRHQAVIIPVTNFAELITAAAPDSKPQGSAAFGAPILLDLGGRGVRSLDRNASGQFLITAGPPGDATGIAPADFRLYAWTGQPADAPFDLGVDLTALDINGGSFESIAEVPQPLAAGSVLQFLLDNGDSVWYADGIAAKDLPEPRFRKAASIEVRVDVSYPAASLSASAGTPQSAIVGNDFAAPLVVQVKDAYGNGIAGVSVGFAAPADGASAVLSAATAATDANGFAGVEATANALAGSYLVNASINGFAGAASFALTNTVDTDADRIFRDGFESTPVR